MAPTPEDTGEVVDRRSFSTSFRGFDQHEVRTYLAQLATEFAHLNARIADLEAQLAVASRPAERPALDVATLTAALGEETGNVLRVARETADELRSRAEEGAARTLREAHEEAARIRGSAESVLAQRSAEAEQVAARIRTVAEEEAARVRRHAENDAQSKIAQAVATGKDMVGQAQAARERVLADLARRRNSALHQLEALRAGRERLTASFINAASEIDHLMEDMAAADSEARRAVESIGVARAPQNTPQTSAPSDSPAPPEAAAEPGADQPAPSEPGPDAGRVSVPAETPGEDSAGEPGADEHGDGEHGADDDASPPGDAAAAEHEAPTVDGGAEADAAAGETPDAGEEAAAVPIGDGSEDQPRPEGGGAAPEAESAAGPQEHAAPDGDGPAGDGGTDTPARPAYAHDPVPAAVFSGPVVGGPPPGGRVDQLFARIRADRLEPAVAVEDLPTQAVEAVTERPEDARLEAPRGDADEAYLQQRDALLEPALASTARALKRSLADDQNAILEKLRTLRADVVDLGELLEDTPAQVRVWGRGVTPGLIEAAAAGARLGGGNPPADLVTVAAIAERLSVALVEPLRSRLAAAIEASGGDRGEAAVDQINGVFREVRGRVERLVGDAVTEALAAGFVAATEPGTAVRWVVDDADGPCADCDDNALAGAVVVGEEFPTGQAAPPAHPGCRCILMRTTT